MRYRIKKVVQRVPVMEDSGGVTFEVAPIVEYVYWCVQVHLFWWIWITVKQYRSDVFEREGKVEDYGQWLAEELLDKLEEED